MRFIELLCMGWLMARRAISQFLDPSVQQLGLDKFQIVVIDPAKYRGRTAMPGQYREDGHLDEVHKTCRQQGMVHR